MKVNCIKKTIDFERITFEIGHFKSSHNGENPPYIIINYDIRGELMKHYSNERYIKDILKDDVKIDMIYGIPVAFSTGLEFGEVDIV